MSINIKQARKVTTDTKVQQRRVRLNAEALSLCDRNTMRCTECNHFAMQHAGTHHKCLTLHNGLQCQCTRTPKQVETDALAECIKVLGMDIPVCTCARINIGVRKTEHRNWNPDCPVHTEQPRRTP
jgi:hypothetical protein